MKQIIKEPNPVGPGNRYFLVLNKDNPEHVSIADKFGLEFGERYGHQALARILGIADESARRRLRAVSDGKRNVQWLMMSGDIQNKQETYIVIQGKRYTSRSLAKKAGISMQTARDRMRAYLEGRKSGADILLSPAKYKREKSLAMNRMDLDFCYEEFLAFCLPWGKHEQYKHILSP